MEIARDTLLTAYARMRLVRAFEERLHDIALQANPFGFAHLYAGAEACAVGVLLHLEPSPRDIVTCAHRPHGHFIAKGGDPVALAKEIFGRAGGCGGGKGGTMHVSDWSIGMHGASGIIGASTPHALGAAFTAKTKKTGGVAVTFGGDGASNQGAVFESLNLAKVLDLPVVFVLEDNGYAEATSKSYACAGRFVDRAAGFGIPARTVDGADFFAVFEAAGEAVERARGGGGPSFLHVDVPLFFAHFEGDQETYRGAGEVARLRAERDCLQLFQRRVSAARLVELSELETIGRAADAEAHAAIAAAATAPAPPLAALFENVYASY